METIQNTNDHQEAVAQVYEYAAALLVNENKSPLEVKDLLIQKGLDAERASIVVENLANQIQEEMKEDAHKDMLYGGLWCMGGIVATAADIGFIFWGAIVFGAIQFCRGLFRSF